MPKSKRGFSPIDHERLDVAENAVLRLLGGFKSNNPNHAGADKRRLELIEEAASSLTAARLLK